MQATDKFTMESNYIKVENALYEAYENLRKAEEILRSDLVIDRVGYCANEINERRTKIYNYRENVRNRILPEIRKL